MYELDPTRARATPASVRQLRYERRRRAKEQRLTIWLENDLVIWLDDLAPLSRNETIRRLVAAMAAGKIEVPGLRGKPPSPLRKALRAAASAVEWLRRGRAGSWPPQASTALSSRAVAKRLSVGSGAGGR